MNRKDAKSAKEEGRRFDRLIIAQSLAESIPVVTKDGAFNTYQTNILW
jgi:PIN domain nuclease of toxin-antitoxin system